ncbi:MAG TPA: hypothetical protein VGO43_07710, partial [Pyrinomonadaceae bacterium]|nr:hypothetical protein [Pyrinomonadaceae bacterium]
MRSFGLAAVLLLLPIMVVAQGSPSADGTAWVRFDSPSRDLSVSLPATGYLVDNQKDHFGLYYAKNDLLVSVAMKKTKEAKNNFLADLKLRAGEKKGKEELFEIGDFYGRRYVDDDKAEDLQSTRLELASSDGRYTLFVRSKTLSASQYTTFLRLIRLNGKPLFETTTSLPLEKQTFSIDSLQTNKVVADALGKPDSNQEKLGPTGTVPTEKDNTVYSKAMILLQRPYPSYTDRARTQKISGIVILSVIFKADGTIGPITLVKSLDKGLD